jgi:hypothetical protein
MSMSKAKTNQAKKLLHVSRRHRAKYVAHREVGNHERLALLRDYEATGRRFRELLVLVYADAGTEASRLERKNLHARRRDSDLLDDGLTGDGVQLREALDHELKMVAEVLRLASNSQFTPVSLDNIEATTAAIMVLEHNATVYQAVRDVHKKLRSGEVSDSHQRKAVQRAIKRRQK